MNAAPPTVIVLAAGRGERFLASGGDRHKLQALLAGRPVLEHTLDAVRASGLPFHVVLPDASRPGMGDSIAAGVRATAQSRGWLILPGDLPLVRAATLLQVAHALAGVGTAPDAGECVVVPVHRGQRGHPVGFAAVCGAHLMALSGDGGAAPVARAFGVRELPVDDPGCVLDVDTVAALAQAQAELERRDR